MSCSSAMTERCSSLTVISAKPGMPPAIATIQLLFDRIPLRHPHGDHLGGQLSDPVGDVQAGPRRLLTGQFTCRSASPAGMALSPRTRQPRDVDRWRRPYGQVGRPCCSPAEHNCPKGRSRGVCADIGDHRPDPAPIHRLLIWWPLNFSASFLCRSPSNSRSEVTSQR